MIASSTKFRPTNKSNSCPICNDTKGKCRTIDSEPIVLCGNTQKGSEPSGWSYRKSASNPLWNVFAPDDGNDSQNWQDRLEERNKHNDAVRAEKAQRLAENPVASIVDRDNGYRHLLAMLPAKLNGKDQADLARRGVTDDQIDQWQIRSIDQWQKLPEQIPERLAGISEGGRSLSNGCEGYIVPIEDPLGRVSGFQICNRRKGDDQPKYPWFSSRNKRNLNGATSNFANEELPLAVAFPERLDLSKLGQIGLCEGLGVKPRIAANKIGIPFIGAAGGHFGKETLSDYIKQIEEILSCVNQEDYGEVWLSRSRQQWRNISKYSNSTKTATETAASHTLSMKTSPSKAVALNSQQPGSKSDESTQTGEQHSTNTESGSICDASKKAKPIRAKILFFPDAGSPENVSVMAISANTFKTCWDLGYKPIVRWWGQFSKPGRDVDELDGSEDIRTLSVTQFLDLPKWRSLKKFTPNQTIEGVYCEFQAPELGQIIAVKAGLGAGKTHRTINILKEMQRGAFVITPTNVLGKNFVGRATKARLPYLYHLQSEGGRSLLQDPAATFVLCPDSVIHLQPRDFAGRVVFVDEAMQNWVAALQRPTAIARYRSQVVEILSEGLKLAHSVILADGNLTDKSCEWWAAMAPDKELVKVQHRKVDFEPLTIDFLDTPDAAGILKRIQSAAVSGEPFAIMTDSKKDALAFHERFKDLGGFCLCADTQDEPWVKDFTDDPDGFIHREQPNYLILSPSGGSGFDINIRGYFSNVFQLGRGVTLVDDLSQHLSRVRDPLAKRTIWVPPVGLPTGNPIKETDLDAVGDALKEYLTADALHGLGDREALNERFNEIVNGLKPQAPIIATQSLEEKYLRAYYREALILAGHNVTTLTGKTSDKSAQTAQADTKVLHRIERAKAVHGAPTITDSEAAKLQNKNSLTLAERTLIARWMLINALPGIDESEDWNATDQAAISKRVSCESKFKFIDDLTENRLIQKARSLWLWNNPDAAKLISRDKWEKILAGTEFKSLKSMELYLDTLRACGLEAVLGLDVITSSSAVVKHFIMNCRKQVNRRKLGKTAKTLASKKAFSDLIEPLGLVMVKAEEHDGRSGRNYTIESEIPASVTDATEAKMTQKIEKISTEQTCSTDAENPFTARDGGATSPSSSPYKERRGACSNSEDINSAVENTIETEPDSPDWMSEESLEGIRNQWNEAESDEEREAWRQIIPPHVLEAAIAA